MTQIEFVKQLPGSHSDFVHFNSRSVFQQRATIETEAKEASLNDIYVNCDLLHQKIIKRLII